MTTRTKRRLAVLALTLGLIAAAPQLFDWITDLNVGSPLTNSVLYFGAERNLVGRFLGFRVGPFQMVLISGPQYRDIAKADGTYIRRVDRNALGGELRWGVNARHAFALPGEALMPRVVCAVALAGVWLMVVCGRLVARGSDE